MNRREFLYASLSLLALGSQAFSHSAHPQVAVTMDDFNWEGGVKLTPEQRNNAILDTLKSARMKAALFVCGKYLEKIEGRMLLKEWDDAGHWVGNHTYSHQNCQDISTDQFCQDILKNENVLRSYNNYQKIFRFPFLKEGDTRQKRDAIRSFLKAHGYRTGHVTIDASDWYIHSRMQERLARNPGADISGYWEYYLKHLSDRADFYNDLSVQVLGRSVKHTLLIHHNELNGLFLPDVLRMFRKKGWELIDAEKAFADPVFSSRPNNVPAGESIIWALAKETGKFEKLLRYPGEDGDYEKEAMDRLGL